MWFCHLTSRTTAFLVCNTVSVSWKVREQNPEPPSTKKHKANKRLFFTLQVFYSAWKSLEGASVPTGEQILAIHLCWDKRELRGSGFHLSRSTTALLHGNRRQPGGREWSGDLVSEQDKEVLPCEDCSVRGEGDPGQQAASKSVRPCRGEGGDPTINTWPTPSWSAESHLRKASSHGGQCGYSNFSDTLNLCSWQRSAWASLVAQMVKNPPAMQETQVWSLGREDPLEKEMATHSSILARRIPWTEEPGGPQFHGVAKSRMHLSNQHFHFLSQDLPTLNQCTC